MMPVLIILGSLIVVVMAIVLIRYFRSSGEAPVSMVLLRLSPKEITEAEARSMGRRLLKLPEDLTVARVDLPGENAGEALLLVAPEQPLTFGLMNCKRPYFNEEDRAELLTIFDHPQTRRAISEHTAWTAVDILGKRPRSQLAREEIYNKMAPIMAELIDDQCLLIFQPGENKVALINEECIRLLAAGDAAGAMGITSAEASGQLVVAEKDDTELNNAIAEARRRLPEVFGAFSRRGKAAKAMIKARFAVGQPEDGGNEYLWLTLTAVDERANTVSGRVENNPIDPGIPAKGQPATVSMDDITDWTFVDEAGKLNGFIAEEILVRRANRRR